MSHYYPNIPEDAVKNINIAVALANEHPSYFLESPYSGAVEVLIKQVLSAQKIGKNAPLSGAYQDGVFPLSEVGENASKWDILIRESEELYNGLKDAGRGEKSGSEEMAFFRTATSLLEKIIGLQERAHGLKQVHEFQQTVLNVMEDCLTPGQRTEIMEKLKNAIGE